MRIAVTGASGFVGGHVVEQLCAEGHTVLTFGRRTSRALERPLPAYLSWDVCTGQIVVPRMDVVVNCAALVGDWGPESAYRRTNVDGTRAVLETFACAERFVHVSTTSVYSDDVVKMRMREDASAGRCRHSAYGRTKAEAEALVRGRRPDAVILRPHIVYGPGDPTILPRIIAARRCGRFVMPGTGRNLLSVTHVANLVLAVSRAIRTPHASGTFNIADAGDVSASDLLTTIFARLGKPTRLVFVPRALAWRAARELERVWPWRKAPRGPSLTRFAVAQLADDHTVDITRARTVLGYEPRWTYRDGPL